MEGATFKLSAGCAGPLHFDTLSDDLLLRILKQPVLTDSDRFQVLPLICKRWAKVAPLAVESAECHADGQDLLLSLSSWLAQHAAAGSLRELYIQVSCSPRDQEEQATRALLVHSVLPACSRLHKLDLGLFIDRHPLGLEGWAANLLHVRSLSLLSSSEAPVTAQLQGLTRMQQLSLTGDGWSFSEGAVLPPLLTHLSLSKLQGKHLPAQLSALTALQALDLAYLSMPAGGYEGLTALTWLKRLQLTYNTHLPSCLSQLTQLLALSLIRTPNHHNTPAMVAAVQEEAVGALPNLMHLTLVVRNYSQTDSVPRLPTTLAVLSRLQSLVWAARADDNPALPPGPYLASLTRLAMHTPTVVANLQQLSEQAGQLAQLTLLHDWWRLPSSDAEGRAAVVSWAGGHAPLQRLCMNLNDRDGALETACQQAQQRKPGLQIDYPESLEYPKSLD